MHAFNLNPSFALLLLMRNPLSGLDAILGNLLVDLRCHKTLQPFFGTFWLAWCLSVHTPSEHMEEPVHMPQQTLQDLVVYLSRCSWFALALLPV